jgi:hypothetical protein
MDCPAAVQDSESLPLKANHFSDPEILSTGMPFTDSNYLAADQDSSTLDVSSLNYDSWEEIRHLWDFKPLPDRSAGIGLQVGPGVDASLFFTPTELQGLGGGPISGPLSSFSQRPDLSHSVAPAHYSQEEVSFSAVLSIQCVS